MDIERKPIGSSANIEDKRPWIDLTVKDGRLEVGEANHDGEPIEIADRDVNYEALLSAARKAGPVRADRDTGIICLMLTMDGRIVAEYECDVFGTYRAHLGFYSVAKNSLELLEFVEDTAAANG